jgi:hypothetical protein
MMTAAIDGSQSLSSFEGQRLRDAPLSRGMTSEIKPTAATRDERQMGAHFAAQKKGRLSRP